MKTGLLGAALLMLACSAMASQAQSCQMGAGTEGRQWLPERARVDNPQLRFPVQVQDGVTITARDGTALDARLWHCQVGSPCRAMAAFRPWRMLPTRTAASATRPR
jgi:hypothetical protein